MTDPAVEASALLLEPDGVMSFVCLLFLEREGGSERVRERERNVSRLPPGCTPIRDLTRNLPGICPDQESNLRPFSVREDTPTNCATPARTVMSSLLVLLGAATS